MHRVRSRTANILVILAALVVAACQRGTEAKVEEKSKPLLLGPEDVIRAELGQVLTGPVISGQLEAQERATVRAQLPGQLIDARIKTGQHVKKGEVLARIRAIAEREAVGSAEAAVRTAQTELDAARRDEERTEVLVKAGALAQRDLEQARTVVAGAKARVAETEAALAAAREQLSESVVRAPITGVISQAPVDSGDVVSVGAELFTVVNPYTMELRASAPAENLGALKVGAPVTFTVQGYGARTFRGSIRRINPAADPATNQVEVYASIPNDAGVLISGLYAQGRIATGSDSGIVVPAEAVHTQGNTNYVLTVSGGQVVRRPVMVGARDERTGKLQILSGLQQEDLVLTGAASNIRPGARVELMEGGG